MSDKRLEQTEPENEEVEAHQKATTQIEASDESEDSDEVEAHSPRTASPRSASPRST